MPYKIKSDTEQDIWRKYMAKCAQMTTENTAGFAHGSYLQMDYDDLINPKPQILQEQGSATEKIRSKLR